MSRHRHHRHRHGHTRYTPSYHSRGGTNTGKIIGILFVIAVLGVMYLLLFNPPIPNVILQYISPIVYVIEFIIFISGLLMLNSYGLGRSDLGVWGMVILAIILIILGVFFFFAAGAVPHAYLGFDAWFGVILGVLGLFALFRAKRRYGNFIYIG